eukprot:4867224-Prymnesium_polylepis.1
MRTRAPAGSDVLRQAATNVAESGRIKESWGNDFRSKPRAAAAALTRAFFCRIAHPHILIGS